MTERRGKRKVRIGRVESNLADKTATVVIERLVRHPIYGKVSRKTTKFVVHDEKNEVQVGDIIEIMETRPLSKTKHWRLVRIVSKAL